MLAVRDSVLHPKVLSFIPILNNGTHKGGYPPFNTDFCAVLKPLIPPTNRN